MTAPAIAPAWRDEDGQACRCVLCLTGYPYNNAYRPHTLSPDCWCMRAPDESPLSGRTKCSMASFGEIPEGRLG